MTAALGEPGAPGDTTLPARAEPPAGPGRPGRLILVPNALDLGAEPQPLSAVLPLGVLQIAAGLAHWLVEDAKTARAFLNRVNQSVPLRETLQSLHITELPRPPKGRRDHGRDGTPTARPPLTELLAPARAGHDIGLLSEAGLPAVADPGAAVVTAAHGLGLEVLPLPGASSLLLALAASGLEGQGFAFVGYLPQDPAARVERIRELEGISKRLRQTQIFIETPYRNSALAAALIESAAPTTRLSISLALTLPEGWSRTATVAAWRTHPPRLSERLPAVFLLQA